MIEAVVGFAVERRRLVLWATLVAALIAAVMCTRLRFDALPDVTTNQVLVLTRAPGLTPEEVERLVTRPSESTADRSPASTARPGACSSDRSLGAATRTHALAELAGPLSLATCSAGQVPSDAHPASNAITTNIASRMPPVYAHPAPRT